MTTEIVGIITLVGAILIFLLARYVATRPPGASYEEVAPGIYRTRRNYFFVLVTILILGLLVTTRYLPYPSSRTPTPAATIDVSAMMWYWQVKSADAGAVVGGKAIVPVGQPVTFDVTSLDVNHDFAVYRPNGKMLGQVQVMPGYHNKVTLTFPEPGIYEVLCLEYCGIGHHKMFTSIEAR